MNNTMIPKDEQSAEDLAFMDEAMIMAEEAFTALEIPVGCVLVHNHQVIAHGRNRTNEGRNATLHAEFDALRHLLPDRTHALTPELMRPFTPQRIGNRWNGDGTSGGEGDHQDASRKIWETPLREVTLYVTVEPCIMCASAMRQVGIGRVVYGCANDRFGGCGGVQSIHADPRLLYSDPYVAVGGYRREGAIMLLRRFYISENTSAPKPKKKAHRTLKTVIPEVPTPTRTASPSSSFIIEGGSK